MKSQYWTLGVVSFLIVLCVLQFIKLSFLSQELAHLTARFERIEPTEMKEMSHFTTQDLAISPPGCAFSCHRK